MRNSMPPEFSFAFHYKHTKIWHIRRIGPRGRLKCPDTPALCRAPITCDIAVDVTLDRMRDPACCIFCMNCCIAETVDPGEPQALGIEDLADQWGEQAGG